MDKISIIVPVYNATRYLKKCINSVLNQQYVNWELILVDDGSTDESFSICQLMSKKDSRIISIHQANTGANAARLQGLKISTGQYITFLDSDDTLPANALQLLLNPIKDGYDIVRGQILNVDENEKILGKQQFQVPCNNEIIGSEQYTLALFYDKIPPYLCGGLYNKKVLSEEDFQVTIDYKISIGEDFITNVYISKKCKKIKFITDPVYYYYKNIYSVMNTSIMGREYCMRVDSSLMKFMNQTSDSIKVAFIVKKTIGIINRFFIPELSFSHKEYLLLQTYMKDKRISDKIYKQMKPKYLACMSHEFIYFIYTRIFCILYKYKKLKGRTRIIKI